jgi:hypothetical protein
MNSDELSGGAGIALSLLGSYCPGFAPWYDKRTPTEKRLIMASLLLIIACAVFVGGCRGWVAITCDEAGVLGLARAFVIALMANQVTHRISPKVTWG